MSLSSTAPAGGLTAASSLTRRAGLSAAALASLSLVLVLLLHVLRPDLGPSWRFLSEYAAGEHGWVMSLAFLAVSIACLALLVALRREIRGIPATLGALFLFAAIVGLGLAAFYPMDPITIDPSEVTDTGRMHALAAMIGIPSMPLSSLLLSLALSRRPGWIGVRAVLFASAGMTLLSLVAMFVVIGTLLPANGGFGPAVIVGWPNRLLMLGYYLWIIAAGWHAAKLGRGHDVAQGR